MEIDMHDNITPDWDATGEDICQRAALDARLAHALTAHFEGDPYWPQIRHDLASDLVESDDVESALTRLFIVVENATIVSNGYSRDKALVRLRKDLNTLRRIALRGAGS
jgi:thioredoxin-like negative regulator of GroEL